jgi:Flp pilus assembly protein TadG
MVKSRSGRKDGNRHAAGRKVRFPGSGSDAGQIAAEIAVVLPVLLVAVLGAVQLSLVAFGSVVARHAAFAGARAAAVTGSLNRDTAAASAAASLIECVPGVRFMSADLKDTPMPLAGLGADFRERKTCRVRARVPKLVPVPGDFMVTASCSLPMEITW